VANLGARRVSRLACPSHGVSGRRSKAAGFVLLLRVLFDALPLEVVGLETVTDGDVRAVTILYGSCARFRKRNLKRLLGYSSIANAGYLLLGVAVLSPAGRIGLLYYLAGISSPCWRPLA